ETAPRAARRLGWQAWLTLLWAAGALAMLGALLAMSLGLRARIRRYGRAPDDDGVRRLYEGLSDGLGLRAAPRLRCLPALESPALTASLRPVLLLPAALAAEQGEALRFSLLHELWHYKRGDHIVCLVYLLLRAVWWFNPVVWLLMRPLRADMEAACDARVARGMARGDKLRYANLLLTLGEENGI
ncbi:MAG: M56 family metallopeptidase, partial [Clostridia bacterium]|nr:M56 family metallopeptidase [Clostridia bacterium]